MTSKTRYNRHRVQCTNTHGCGARDVLKKHPDEYKRRPRCGVCGGNVYSIEKARRNELTKQDTCYCLPYPFPHKRGSLRMCTGHPLADAEPTDEEWEQYQECLQTPRSG